MAFGKLIQAAYIVPPVDATEDAVSTTSTAAVDGALTGGPEVFYSFICTQAFNIEFGTASVGQPSANYMFAAGALYSFAISPDVTNFRIRATAAGTVKWWKSSRA
jgi:hypothetical protein